MRLPFFSAIICSLSACVASVLVGFTSPAAVGQQGSQLPAIQQNQPQVVSPMRPTVVERGFSSELEAGAQNNWAPFQAGPSSTEFDPDRRRDSNVLGVRSFSNPSSPGESSFHSSTSSNNDGFQGMPLRTSLSEGPRGNEQGGGTGGNTWLATGQNQSGFPQQNNALPSITGLSGQPTGQSSAGQLQASGNSNLSGGQNPQLQNPQFQNPQFQNLQFQNPQPQNPQPQNPNFSPSRGSGGQGNTNPPLLSMPGGEAMSPGNRILQSERTERSDRTQESNLLAWQTRIGGWDSRLVIPDIANTVAPLPRKGRRSSIAADDGFDETVETENRRFLDERPSQQQGGSGSVPASFVTGQESKNPSGTTPEPRTGNPTDPLASLLTVCFFLGNLVLAYFLYDSRMKYQHLADEIQSRFFRET